MSLISDYLGGLKKKIAIKSQLGREKSINVFEGGKTIVHYAAERGDIEFLEMIFSKLNKEIVNKLSEEGKTPLAYAAISGNSETINFLLSRDADLTIHGDNSHSAIFELFQNETTQNLAVTLMQQNEDVAIKLASELGETMNQALLTTLVSSLQTLSQDLISEFNSSYPTTLHEADSVCEDGLTGVTVFGLDDSCVWND